MCEKAAANSDQTFDITLDMDISKRTSELADENRRHLDAHDVRCLDVMGSVGCGKTTLIRSRTAPSTCGASTRTCVRP